MRPMRYTTGTVARRGRPQRWRDTVQTLMGFQVEYQDWLDNLPDNLQVSTLAEKLETICEYDFGDLEALEPPCGFGRDWRGRTQRGRHDAD